jgi:hypothetical protein
LQTPSLVYLQAALSCSCPAQDIDQHIDPLAVGVYTAIARLAVAAKDAVPLGARDLVAWMESDRAADRAAIVRRIVKLEERGWLMMTRTRASKHHLLPT